MSLCASTVGNSGVTMHSKHTVLVALSSKVEQAWMIEEQLIIVIITFGCVCRALFPCGDSMVCIIDDREDVWNFAPNLVHVKPYRFFQGTADINAPPGLTKSENDDIPIKHKIIDHQKESTVTTFAAPDVNPIVPVTTGITPGTDISGSSEECILQKVARSEGDVTVPEEVPLKSISSVRGEESGTEITVDTPEGGTGDSSKCEKMMEIDEIAEPKKSSEESDQKDLKSEQTSGECAVKSAEMQNQVSEDLSLSSDSDEDSGDMLASVDNRRQEESAQASGRIDEKNNESEVDINIVEDKKSDKSKDSTGIGNINNNHLTSQEVLQIPLAVDSCEPNVKKEITPTGDEKNRPVDDFTDTNKMSSSDKEHPQEKDESIEWDDNDDYLLHLEDILTRIHKAFYTMYDESLNKGSISNQAKTSIFNVASVSTISIDSSSVDTVDTPATHAETSVMPSKDATVPSASSSDDSSIPLFSSSSLFPNQPLPDLKSIIPYVKRKTLRGCNIVFSGLVPLNTPLEKSQAYIIARALGANVQPDIVDAKQVGSKELATTHLVAAKPGTSKHKVALRVGKIHIVSSDWLWACSERWENCDPCLFPLSKDSANSNLISVIPEKGLKLDNKQKCLKRMSNNDEVWDEGREETVNFEQNKRQKMEDNVERSEGVVAVAQAKAELASDEEAGILSESGGASFASTVHPLLSFSDEDLECMDKEVDDLLAEDASGSSEESEERNERLRKKVLGGADETDSSSDSLSGDFPRGWRLKRKVSSPHSADDDLEKRQLKESEIETEDTENEFDRFQKTVDTFAPDTDTSSSDADSIGSVDDEIADAVEKEFLASL